MRDRKGGDPDGRGSREDLGRETVIRIYEGGKKLFSIKEPKNLNYYHKYE